MWYNSDEIDMIKYIMKIKQLTKIIDNKKYNKYNRIWNKKYKIYNENNNKANNKNNKDNSGREKV